MTKQSTLLEASDETLCLMLKNNQAGTLEQLLERYMPMVKQRARFFSQLSAETDDLMQEGLIALVNATRCYEAGHAASFKTYAYQAVTNRMISAIRALKQPLAESYDEWLHLESTEQDPFEILIGNENVNNWLNNSYKLLTVFEKDTIKLYLDGYSYREMAASLHSSTKAVDNALQRARNKLRSCYTQTNSFEC